MILIALGLAVFAGGPAEAAEKARSRFGLGLEAFFEHQESLKITSQEETIRARDLVLGQSEGGIFQQAPDLLNRKFDVLLELEGAGLQLPVFLPRLGVVQPTLFVQAASANVTLDFLDRTQGLDSVAYEGRGPLYGAGLELTASLCGTCPWFTGSGYRFQRLDDLYSGRSPRFAPAGFDVQDDEVRLSRDVHEASTWVGYGFPGGRVVSYVGARYRSTRLEVRDHLRYVSGDVETTLDARTGLESEVTLALAGVETRLGPRLLGRIETSVGEEDWGVWFRMVYLGVSWPPSQGGGLGEPRETEEEKEQRERRIEEISGAIASRLAAIEAAFLAGWKGLEVVEGPDGQPAYRTREVEALLNGTEKDILAVLKGFPELEALGDWVSDEFRAVRTELGLETPKVAARVVSISFNDEFRLLQDRGSLDKPKADRSLQQAAAKPVGTPPRLAREKRLMVLFTFEGRTLGKGAQLRIHPRFNSSRVQLLPRGGFDWLWVGSYSYKVERNEEKLPFCDARTTEGKAPCPLNLLLNRCPRLSCDEEECSCQ